MYGVQPFRTTVFRMIGPLGSNTWWSALLDKIYDDRPSWIKYMMIGPPDQIYDDWPSWIKYMMIGPPWSNIWWSALLDQIWVIIRCLGPNMGGLLLLGPNFYCFVFLDQICETFRLGTNILLIVFSNLDQLSKTFRQGGQLRVQPAWIYLRCSTPSGENKLFRNLTGALISPGS
jgi:hypothetical protein